MSQQDSNFNYFSSDDLPEFKLVSTYIHVIDHLVRTLGEEAPYNLLTPQFHEAVEKVKKAVFDLRVEYAIQFKFQQFK